MQFDDPIVSVQPRLGQHMGGQFSGRGAKVTAIFGKCGLQQDKGGLVGQAIHDHTRHHLAPVRQARASTGALACKYFQRHARGIRIPALRQTQDMARVRGGNARNLHQPAVGQAAQGGLFAPVAQDAAKWMCLLPDTVQHLGVFFIQARRAQVGHGPHKTGNVIGWRFLTQLRVKQWQHDIGRLMGQQTDGQHAFWAKRDATRQALGHEMGFAVTAQPHCAHCHGFDHRAIGPDARTRRIDCRSPVAQHRHVGGCATNVADQRI